MPVQDLIRDAIDRARRELPEGYQGEPPFIQVWPVFRDEVASAHWLMLDAGYPVVSMAVWRVDPESGQGTDYLLVGGLTVT